MTATGVMRPEHQGHLPHDRARKESQGHLPHKRDRIERAVSLENDSCVYFH